ncbi:MAG: nicotinate-nucleotide--dimethylbenzimidazole phosphoribosyltransferase [Proteobacteria bacterium]|nr:nicotinate-nucleotide--dimethylbenzimidazole phosphoribosyltransferase [Pseudomonadota bacterium]MBU1390028.1 nicotinate-nucleotide--dimethylbenzimidazole phosphoribosyltransferase [Pseudomonadota bacterium]MBU1545021.1 nicotinate-nucleotide--dimethylbenzimidazole phosphoribosyltransferase [Pseudomonadota bacterium]MBU2430332.1 nicotinate-nucleotide--dimethylbenzimidazole phosphoribosyltransferase [Pseudomonadota bacterium]MBU2480375.1 nicotinate-nucleotide--dimethylbenzimidazole phosphoribo
MGLLEQTIAAISAKLDEDAFHAAKERLANQAKPAGSLGIMEDISARLAAIKGTINVQLKNKQIVTCAGDHGVTEEGISLFPSEVTPQMVYNFANQGASVNVIGKHAGATVKAADIGVNHDFEPDLPIFHKKVRYGTANFTKEPAMTRDEAIRSIEAGIEIINELDAQRPVDLLGTGDMGIGNTTPSSALISVFSGIDAEKLTGRGTGIDDATLKNKIAVIKKGLALHRPDPADPVDVLSKVGGLEIGALAGLVLGAAAKKIPVICDGLISTAGALIACELAPFAKNYLFASHKSVEIGHKFMHDHLGLDPLIDLKFRLGEGTGAAVCMELLDLSTRILADIKTFEEVGINNAQ